MELEYDKETGQVSRLSQASDSYTVEVVKGIMEHDVHCIIWWYQHDRGIPYLILWNGSRKDLEEICEMRNQKG